MARPEFDARAFGALHDMQLDHYGQRLATASGDHKVRVWDGAEHRVLTELSGHPQPVVCVAWGSGRFANLLASASSGGHVIVWREVKRDEWQLSHHLDTGSPVSVVAFAPGDYGLMLGVAKLGGDVLILTQREVKASPVLPSGEQWISRPIPAHASEGGVIAMAWAPSTGPATLASGPAAPRGALLAPRRIATCGRSTVVIWRQDEKSEAWSQEAELSASHEGSLRDVAFRPNLGIPSVTLAACAEDGTVVFWVQDMDGRPWESRAQWNVGGDARRLSWSKAGVTLVVSVGDSEAFAYGEGAAGKWERLSALTDDGPQ